MLQRLSYHSQRFVNERINSVKLTKNSKKNKYFQRRAISYHLIKSKADSSGVIPHAIFYDWVRLAIAKPGAYGVHVSQVSVTFESIPLPLGKYHALKHSQTHHSQTQCLLLAKSNAFTLMEPALATPVPVAGVL